METNIPIVHKGHSFDVTFGVNKPLKAELLSLKSRLLSKNLNADQNEERKKKLEEEMNQMVKGIQLENSEYVLSIEDYCTRKWACGVYKWKFYNVCGLAAQVVFRIKKKPENTKTVDTETSAKKVTAHQWFPSYDIDSGYNPPYTSFTESEAGRFLFESNILFPSRSHTPYVITSEQTNQNGDRMDTSEQTMYYSTEGNSPAQSESRLYKSSSYEGIENNTNIPTGMYLHPDDQANNDEVINQAEPEEEPMNQEELEEHANIEFRANEGVLLVDNKLISPYGKCQILVDGQQTIAVVVDNGITIYHRYAHQIKIGSTCQSHCRLIEKNKSIWIIVCMHRKLYVYDSSIGVLLKVFETSAKEDIVQWDYNDNNFVYLTKDNQLCIVENFDERLKEINVPEKAKMKNRKTVNLSFPVIYSAPQLYDIPVAESAGERDERDKLIEGIREVFGYEKGDFELGKGYFNIDTKVCLKPNSFSKLKKIKVTKQLQNIDCFLIQDKMVIAHNTQPSQLVKIQLNTPVTIGITLKSMETVHLSHSGVGPQLISDGYGDYIVYIGPKNAPKLLVYRIDQGLNVQSELNLNSYKRWPVLNAGFDQEVHHLLTVEFYNPTILNDKALRGEVDLRHTLLHVQKIHESELPLGYFKYKNRQPHANSVAPFSLDDDFFQTMEEDFVNEK